ANHLSTQASYIAVKEAFSRARPGSDHLELSFPRKWGSRRHSSLALDPRLRGCNQINAGASGQFVRRSRASGNPGISVTCPGPPLSRGRRSFGGAWNWITPFLGGVTK